MVLSKLCCEGIITSSEVSVVTKSVTKLVWKHGMVKRKKGKEERRVVWCVKHYAALLCQHRVYLSCCKSNCGCDVLCNLPDMTPHTL